MGKCRCRSPWCPGIGHSYHSRFCHLRIRRRVVDRLCPWVLETVKRRRTLHDIHIDIHPPNQYIWHFCRMYWGRVWNIRSPAAYTVGHVFRVRCLWNSGCICNRILPPNRCTVHFDDSRWDGSNCTHLRVVYRVVLVCFRARYPWIHLDSGMCIQPFDRCSRQTDGSHSRQWGTRWRPNTIRPSLADSWSGMCTWGRRSQVGRLRWDASCTGSVHRCGTRAVVGSVEARTICRGESIGEATRPETRSCSGMCIPVEDPDRWRLCGSRAFQCDTHPPAWGDKFFRVCWRDRYFRQRNPLCICTCTLPGCPCSRRSASNRYCRWRTRWLGADIVFQVDWLGRLRGRREWPDNDTRTNPQCRCRWPLSSSRFDPLRIRQWVACTSFQVDSFDQS